MFTLTRGMLAVGGVAVVLVVGLLIFGANMSQEQKNAYAKQDRVEAECDKMMSDSALGDERRITRSMCDGMKALVAQDVRNAK
jgi:hypothetical protein